MTSSTDIDTTNVLSSSAEEGPDDIVAALAPLFGFSKDEIEEHTRRAPVTHARQTIMFMLREYGGMSYPAIGRLVGGRDHTTVIHAYNKIKKMADDSPSLFDDLTEAMALAQDIRRRGELAKKELEELNERIRAEAMERIRFTKGERKSLRVRVISDRNLKILEMYRDGLTLQNMADVFGLSRERIRQIVLSTIQCQAINESLSKGIVMDVDVMLEEEQKKRQTARDGRKPVKPVKVKRWSRYYDACKECGLTTYAHVRRGLCERCANIYRPESREKIIAELGTVCGACGLSRPETFRTYGRDFYITKDMQLLCRKHFLSRTGETMGHYKNHEWSRFHPKCVRCGRTDIPHARSGRCVGCSTYVSPERREELIAEKGNQCERCGTSRDDARTKFGADLRLTKNKETLCLDCFQKYIRGKG